MQPVPIHANATAHVNAVQSSDRPRKFVDTPSAIGIPHQNAMSSGWRDQSLGLPCVTDTLILDFESGTAILAGIAFGAGDLNRRTPDGAVGAEHSAIDCAVCGNPPS